MSRTVQLAASGETKRTLTAWRHPVNLWCGRSWPARLSRPPGHADGECGSHDPPLQGHVAWGHLPMHEAAQYCARSATCGRAACCRSHCGARAGRSVAGGVAWGRRGGWKVPVTRMRQMTWSLRANRVHAARSCLHVHHLSVAWSASILHYDLKGPQSSVPSERVTWQRSPDRRVLAPLSGGE